MRGCSASFMVREITNDFIPGHSPSPPPILRIASNVLRPMSSVVEPAVEVVEIDLGVVDDPIAFPAGVCDAAVETHGHGVSDAAPRSNRRST
jgi:hypothetical protein